MVTLESSLNSLKLALAQYGTAGAVGQVSALLPTAQNGVQLGMQPSAPAVSDVSGISLTQSAARQLDLQRQLDSAYRAQAMLEVAGNASAEMMTRLKNLKKVTVQATRETLVDSERAFLISQFEGLRQNILSTAQNTRWNGARLFDGSAGSGRDGVLSFTVGAGSGGTVNLAMPNLREDAVRLSGVRAVQGSLGPGRAEQQTLDLTGARLAYASATLTVGDTTLSAGTLGADATVAGLVSAFSNDAGYADAPFTLADDGANGLTLAWKTNGAIEAAAQLQLTATPATISATRSVTGASVSDLPAQSEKQFISLTDSDLASGVSVLLADGSDAQNSVGLALSGGTTVSALADAINASYADDLPFTVTAESGGLRLNWRTTGERSGLASLAVSAPDAAGTGFATAVFGASQVTAGAAAGRREVQGIALDASAIGGRTFTLSANGVTLSSGAMADGAGMADLVSAFQSDAAYADAGFEIAQDTANGVATGLVLNWSTEATVSELASLSMIDSIAASSVTAAESIAGSSTSVDDGTREVQQIAVRTSTIAGRNVQLRAGDVTLFSGVLSESASVSQLADALKNDARYASGPFTVSQERQGFLTLSWKTPGAVTQLAALEVQPEMPLLSLLKRGGIATATAATSMSRAVDLAIETLGRVSDDLGVAGLQLASAVQSLATRQPVTTASLTQQAGTAYVSAIGSMLRTQIAGNTSQATQAQANFTPQAVINTLQF